MPIYQYQGRQAEPELIEAGDYEFIVVSAVDKISNGAKTSGCKTIELKLKIVDNGKTIYDTLIFAPSTEWKIDTFVQSVGLAPEREGMIDVNVENCMGATGWCSVKVETYNDSPRNKIGNYILPKNPIQSDNPDW